MSIRPQPRPRAGFTLIEALVAVGVLVIALGGIAGLAATITRKSRTPDDLGKATYFAAERMSYFRADLGRAATATSRGSVSGYVAAGGTYYPPPLDARPGVADPNRDPAYHNVAFNKVPTLLVREFLYDATETLDFDALTGERLGERNRKRRNVPGRSFARNEIPATPAMATGADGALHRVGRVVPNPDAAAAPATAAQPDGSIAIPAPRANDHLRGVGFSLADQSIRFVREVWVQPMHPMFPPAALAGGPRFVAAPPYSVVVTVRVFRRNPLVKEFAPVATGPTRGPGYDGGKPPLAELVGCIGLP